MVAELLPNSELGALYRSSYCTLNDHWSDMSRFDYVNNRVFDALACALPVLSENHHGLASLGFRAIKIKEDTQPIGDAIDELVAQYESYQDAAYLDSELVLEEHTFGARARTLMSILVR